MKESEGENSISSDEVLYILSEGDVTRAEVVKNISAENIYRWMLTKLRYMQRLSNTDSGTDREIIE